MSDNIILVSADSHGGARPEDYRPYMEQLALEHYDDFLEDSASFVEGLENLTSPTGAFSPDRLSLIDEDNVFRSGGAQGTWDLARRLQEMDREGVAGEMIVHSHQNSIEPFFTPSNRRTALDLRVAGLRAYHRWMAEFIAEAGGRLLGIADTAGVDMDATVAELRWCADRGFRAVHVPPGFAREPALPPLYDEYYEPLWNVCSETGLRLVFHGGWAMAAHGGAREARGMMHGSATAEPDPHQAERMSKALGNQSLFEVLPRRAIWQLLVGGVFDRHPDLKVVLVELRADWVPQTFKVFDERFAEGDTPLTMMPSEYFAQNFYAAPSSTRRCEVELRHEIGVSRFMFGRDYPHPESTWPNTIDWIRATFAGVPEDEARLMLGENAIECFGFDRDKMAEVAARIGPKPADLLGDHDVDPALIEHFHLRSGYGAAAVNIDNDALGRMVDKQLAQLAAT
jgi:predicted TIM-barrel fold metal-dependent hydrolase